MSTKLGLPKNPLSRKHYGGGLYLQTGDTGSASWLLRYQRGGKEHWMGLGPKDVFNAKEARARARAAQQKLYDGVDPLQARKAQRTQQALEAARAITFKDAADQYFAQHEGKWSGVKTAQQFKNTLAQYAYPVIGKLPVADVDTTFVLKIVEPIWVTKHQTASRLRGRIEAVLDWAKIRGFRKDENPARWSGHLDQVLPTGPNIGKVVHHPALPYAEVPGFVAELAKRSGIGPKALTFLILTAARTDEVLGAKWPEFELRKIPVTTHDEDGRETTVTGPCWIIPAPRMKKRKRQHRVPLTDAMLKILKSLPREDGNELVFIGTRTGERIGKMTMPMLVDAMGHDVTIHGFRSSFRDWCADRTTFPREMAEIALSHKVGTEVERAYLRSDVFEKRRSLMEKWSVYVSTTPRKITGNNVTPIRKARSV